LGLRRQGIAHDSAAEPELQIINPLGIGTAQSYCKSQVGNLRVNLIPRAGIEPMQ
jgi:hypothetical protein